DYEYKSYAWGMAINLNSCVGCNACVVACQAENNIPIVGKEEVLRSREMHWLRIDHYFEGDPAEPRSVMMPVPCMHCENAPCELATACQAACPTHAIVFGDINDSKAEVTELKRSPLNYGLLAELNTRPRTTYLGRVRNPNPELNET